MTSSARKYPLFLPIVIPSLLIISGLVLFSFFKPKATSEQIQPLPQDPIIKVYFNQNQASQYQEPYRDFVRSGDNLEQQIIDTINQAQSSIDVAVMEFRLPGIADALIAKHKSGVKVRILIDNQYNKTLADYTSQEIAKMNPHDQSAYEELKRYPADALEKVRKSGIEIKDDTSDGATKGSGIMHHKFIIVDRQTIIISSGNFTTSELHGDFKTPESRGNPNNMVIVYNTPQLATIFTEEFNYMWQGLFKSRKPDRLPATVTTETSKITVHFAPASKKESLQTTNNGMIASFLQQSASSIHIAVFVYSDPFLGATLEQVYEQRKIKDLKVLIDPDFYQQSYSKAYDMLGVCPASQTTNSSNKTRPWKRPITTIGFPSALTGDRGVHSKMAILDEKIVLTGSQNWSLAGNYSNDETLIAIENTTVAAHYEREFNRLYQNAVVGLDSLSKFKKCS